LPENWDRFWDAWNIRQTLEVLRTAQGSARTRKMDMRIRQYLGCFEGLEVIELGSGIGTQSLIMSLKGAQVTLVDSSKNALDRAKEFFKKFALSPTCCQTDIFRLPHNLFKKFDISMSFGTVEHFLQDDQRKESIKIHHRLLKDNGISFISVPNKMSPHYRLFSFLVKKTHIAKGPLEKPFDTFELIKYAKQAGFRYCETFGSSLFEFDYLMPHVYMPVQAQIPMKFDDRYAHSLTLFAIR